MRRSSRDNNITSVIMLELLHHVHSRHSDSPIDFLMKSHLLVIPNIVYARGLRLVHQIKNTQTVAYS